MKKIYTIISILIASVSFAQNTVNYQYDNENRITSSDDGSKSQNYQYDNLGNRTNYVLTATAASIDLSVDNISVPSTNIERGQSYGISCTVYNLGTANVGTSTLKVYLSPTATGTDTQVGTYAVPSILASASENVSLNISIPASATLGSQQLVFFIDATSSITEIDETNNKANTAVTVTAPNLAELNVQNAQTGSNSVQAGNSINLSASVFNEGNVVANNFSVKTFLSINATYEANDILLADTVQDYASLEAGDNTAYTQTALIPSNTIADNYYILFVVDEEGVITEIDETNNVEAVSIIVTGSTNEPIADFIVTNQSVAVNTAVHFIDQSTNSPTSWQWTFESGTPSTSTEQNPVVTYDTEGIFNVTLIASNASGSSTEERIDYITVGACVGEWSLVGTDGFSSGGAENLKIEIDNNGTPYVAFIDYANDNMATVMKYDGTSWTLVGNAGFSGVTVGYLDLKIANDNTPYIAYRNYFGTRKVTVKKFNGTSWINVGVPDFTTDVIGNPSIAITSTNQLYVSFQEYYDSYSLRVMKFNGSSWIYAGNSILTYGDNTTTYPTFHSLEIDGADNVYIAYQDISNSDRIAVKKYDNGSNWNYVGVASVSAGAAQYPSLAFNSSNIPYVAYKDVVNNDKTTVKWFTNGTWNTVGTAGFAPGGYTSYQKIVISNDNTPYVSMKYNSYGTSVMKYEGGSWVNVGTVDFPNTATPNYQRMTISNDDIPYLVYRDGSNSNKTSVMKFACETGVTADFYANNTLGNTGSIFVLTDASTNNPTSWNWTISPSTFTYVNGTSNTSQNPEIVFNDLGLYTITLEVSNSESSDSITKTDYINITEPMTYVPDDNFEYYLETHNENGDVVSIGASDSMGNGIDNDDYVLTSNINTVTSLNVTANNISDLTGIQDFVELMYLTCRENQISSLDISNNILLTFLDCNFNQISSLDVSQNIALTTLKVWGNNLISLNVTPNVNLVSLSCGTNQITSLDISNNTALEFFECQINEIVSLDVSQLANLTYFACYSNQLTTLNVKNGNNPLFTYFNATNNPNLTCIYVDDSNWSTANWTNIDTTSTFVETETECSTVGIDDFLNQNIKIFPNPTNSILNIESNSDIFIQKMSIYDITGKLLDNFKGNPQIISIKNYANGVYYINIITKNGKIVKKIVKQ